VRYPALRSYRMISVLAFATVLMIVISVASASWCRSQWPQYSGRAKRLLLAPAAISVMTYTTMLLTGWHFASPFANELLGSFAIGGYSLIVLLLTLLGPKPRFYGLVLVFLLREICTLIRSGGMQELWEVPETPS
jgi:hypothetical protein